MMSFTLHAHFCCGHLGQSPYPLCRLHVTCYTAPPLPSPGDCAYVPRALETVAPESLWALLSDDTSIIRTSLNGEPAFREGRRLLFSLSSEAACLCPSLVMMFRAAFQITVQKHSDYHQRDMYYVYAIKFQKESFIWLENELLFTFLWVRLVCLLIINEAQKQPLKEPLKHRFIGCRLHSAAS